MREDMFKVIVERPRLFRARALRVKSRYDRLPDRTKVGMKRAAQEQRGWTKGLNENLAPLRRYLWKQRGRAWNDVYSEICARLDNRSTVKQHVRDHLEDIIDFRVFVGKDGSIYDRGGWPLHKSGARLYVDPHDGIIKEVAVLRRALGLPESRRTKKRTPPMDMVVLGDWEELRRIKGIWMWVRFDQDQLAPRHDRVIDVLERQSVWVGRRHAVEKRQLSSAELSARGLSNVSDV